MTDERDLLGYALARYREAQHLDDATLVAQLEIAPDELDDLRAFPLSPWGDPFGIGLGCIAETSGAPCSSSRVINTARQF
jgi:hypothetical protein